METFQTLITIALVSLFSNIISRTIGQVFEFLVRLVFTVIVIESGKAVREIDALLIKKYPRRDVTIASGSKPTNTFHLRMVGWFGMVIYIRDTNNRYHNNQFDYYTIYTTSRVIEKLQTEISLFQEDGELATNATTTKHEEKKTRLKISDYEASTPWNTSFTTENRDMFLKEAFPGQKECKLEENV